MSEEKAASREAHPERWVEETMRGFIAGEVNRLALEGEVIYDEPLVGFARGDDPLFRRYKQVIGKFHYTPLECRFFPQGGYYRRSSGASPLGFGEECSRRDWRHGQ